MSEIELRPCPFCGEQDLLRTYEDYGPSSSYCVQCSSCGASGPYKDKKQRAALAWNSRSKQDAN